MKRQRLVAAEELFAARKKVPAPSISAALPSADAVVSVPTAPAAPPSTEGRTVLVQLQAEGSTAAASPTLDIPADTTPRQLEALVNKLLNASEAQPYTFYINGEEVLKDVASSLGEQALNAEATLMIRYQPLAVFRVMPVTRCTDTLEGHADSVLHVSFAPDGRRLASGGGDAIVRFWDAASASIRHVCVGHKHHVLATAWSPDGRLFASGDKAGALRLWDPDTGKEAVSIRAGHAAWITAIAWEPLHRSTAADARCELVATASKDKTVKVWNARTGLLQFELGGHSDSVEALRWGGEGLIFTGSRDRKVLVWAVADDKLSAKLIRSLDSHGHRINALALNTDYMCRTGPYDHKGARFVSDVEAKSSAQARYSKALASMGGAELLASCSDDFTLCLWSPGTSKAVVARMAGHQALVNHIVFSPDGRYIASAGFDKKVKIWDGRTGKFLTTLTGHVGAVYQVSWAADSRFLASASRDSTVKVWNTRLGGSEGAAAKPVALNTLAGHADEVFALDWSPKGDMLASGSRDRTVKVWRH